MNIFSLPINDFNLAHTLECGQVFRWNKLGDYEYEAVVAGSIIRIKQKKRRLFISSSNRRLTPSFIKSYFDLTLDLRPIYNKIGKDKYIKAAIKRFWGLRIIRQPLWECLVSFIISTQNNIPRIKGIIERLSGCFGRPILFDGTVRHTFPGAKAIADLTTRQLEGCGTGYRADFLREAAPAFLKKRLTAGMLKNEPYEGAKARLLDFRGVGQKVADCVLLYAAGRLEAFPVDVWIKKIMQGLYFNGREVAEDRLREFAREYFGEYAGYAQQYLYHYARNER